MKRTGLMIVAVAAVALALAAGCKDEPTHPPADNSPVMSGFSPVRGPVGTAVTITGEHFGATAAENVVAFNGTPAEVTSASATQLVAEVPAGATTGPLTVTVDRGSTTLSTPFTVTTGGGTLIGGSFQGQPLALAPTVSVFAGSGAVGTLDAVGTAAEFDDADGITTDGAYLYVTDSNRNTIRRIEIASATVTTIAGTAGAEGTADGVGAAARFHWPSGITTDGEFLYISDTGRIRKLEIATNNVTTVASGAGLGMLYGITCNGPYLYAAGRGVGVVRVTIATGAITTLAGTESLDFPHGMATDGVNLFVSESGTGNNRVWKIVIDTGAISLLAGAGPAGTANGIGAAASFGFPAGLACDGTWLYLADETNGSVRRIGIADGVVTTITGGFAVTGYATTDGVSLFVTDRLHRQVKRIQ